MENLPHNEEAEQSVLGSILFDPDIALVVTEELNSNDFYNGCNANIFTAIKELAENNMYIDVVSIKTKLKEKKSLEMSGGMAYISELTELLPSSVNVDTYIKIVKKDSLKRKLLLGCEAIKRDMKKNTNRSTEEIISDVEGRFLSLTDQNVTKDFDDIDDVIGDVVTTIKKNSANKNKGITGLDSGVSTFNKMTLGFQNGELIILAARPAMGKSALAVNLAYNVAKAGKKVAIFSLEMSSEQVALRLLSSTTGIESSKLRSGTLNENEWKKVGVVSTEIAKLDIKFEDSSGTKISELYSKCKQLQRKEGLDFIIIDYLQLLTGSGKYGGNRVTEVSEISRKLKNLARDLNVPVLALSQLSRSVESRPDKRPMMSDLRESGSIEQDADIVSFLYRDGYYNQPENPIENDSCEPVEWIVRKNRNGGLGTCELIFNKFIGKFYERSYQEYEKF